jgi:signal transduction histidine kinase
MTFGREGSLRYVWRVVETAGAASVQGALLDDEVLRGLWLQRLLARHRTGDVTLAVRPWDTPGGCEHQARLPPPLDDLALCAAGLGPAEGTSLAWQRLALLGVLATLVLATWARQRAHAREVALAAVERSFVASVSHELRTPLATLRLHAEMLAEGWVTEARRAKVLKDLVAQTTRLSRLVEDVLTFGRLAAGRATVELVELDLAGRVRALLEAERERLEARGVLLDASGVPSEEVRARVDPTALEQVLLNLLENAARYGLGTDPTVSVGVAVRGEHCLLYVQDRGAGIPEAERERVFDRFYRGESASRSHVAGTGLGLAIVRGLSRAMGGDARVAPSEGPGCRVEVLLARAISAPS